MSYPFLKGHGTENDFVLLPDHDGALHGDLSAARVRALCDRRAGIGGDGVLRVIRTSASTTPCSRRYCAKTRVPLPHISATDPSALR